MDRLPGPGDARRGGALGDVQIGDFGRHDQLCHRRIIRIVIRFGVVVVGVVVVFRIIRSIGIGGTVVFIGNDRLVDHFSGIDIVLCDMIGFGNRNRISCIQCTVVDRCIRCIRQVVIQSHMGRRSASVVFDRNSIFDIVTDACLTVPVSIDESVGFGHFQDRPPSLAPVPVTARSIKIGEVDRFLTGIGRIDGVVIIIVGIVQAIPVIVCAARGDIGRPVIVGIPSFERIRITIIVTVGITIVGDTVHVGICRIDPLTVGIVSIVYPVVIIIDDRTCATKRRDIINRRLSFDIVDDAVIVAVDIEIIGVAVSVGIGK